MQAISFPRAQGLPIGGGRNHRPACFQQSLLPAVFPTFPCDTNIPRHMALPYPFTRKIAAIQISFVFQCSARNSRRYLPSPTALVIPYPSLTRDFGSFERQACELRHDRNPFWGFHFERGGFRMPPESSPAVWRKHSTPASFQQHRAEAAIPGSEEPSSIRQTPSRDLSVQQKRRPPK